jgi:hypothetical protein
MRDKNNFGHGQSQATIGPPPDLRRAFARMSARDISATLGGKRMDDGNYLCRCPCPMHKRGDRNPSLSVKDGRDGKLLLFCFAGGEFPEIVKALEQRGVFPGRRP